MGVYLLPLKALLDLGRPGLGASRRGQAQGSWWSPVLGQSPMVPCSQIPYHEGWEEAQMPVTAGCRVLGARTCQGTALSLLRGRRKPRS